jgi:hypothetical protein
MAGFQMSTEALAGGFLSPLNKLMSSALQLQMLEVYLERLNNVMETPPEQENSAAATAGVKRRIICELLRAKCERTGINRVRTEQARGFLAPVTPLRVALNNTHRLQIPFFTAG